ncbi:MULTISPECIES: hypothetical protein [Eubacterium]|uniref:hypothetical protein n=1 Tax=Eubacterium TaxID=1730 RepID=UPI00165231AC|nr:MULTISPECIES: hypothetical protein [Eubacterium]MBV1684694.1 hypothetical protein [Eubacterium callanderi]
MTDGFINVFHGFSLFNLIENGELKGQIGFADLIYIKFALRICTDNSPFSILHSPFKKGAFRPFF